MKIQRIWILSGPNIWSHQAMAEAWVDLGEFRTPPAGFYASLGDRLLALLPGLAAHPGPGGEPQAFATAIRQGTSLAYVLERVALELQTQAGHAVAFGKTTERSPEPALCKVAVQYLAEPVVQAALALGLRLIHALALGAEFALAPELKRLAKLAAQNTLGRTTAAMVAAIERRGLPYQYLNPNDGRLVLVGWGKKSRRLLASQTDRTSAIGVNVSTDKDLAKQLLRVNGIPVPAGRLVCDEQDAWAAAEVLGVPVVVKPLDRDLGMAVELYLTRREEVMAAYVAAREKSDYVLVEKQAPGAAHRLLVAGGKLVAAVRLDPPRVTGDGASTIGQLIETANADPRRDDAYRTPLAKLRLDDKALVAIGRQGCTLDSVPAAGRQIVLRHDADLIESGGNVTEITDCVHQEVAARAVEAARVLGLDVAGLDIVTPDITRPLEEQGGVVVEVNAGPALWLHMDPYSRQGHAAADAILATLIPEHDDGRIPLVAVTGVNGKTTTTRLIAHILSQNCRTVGMACTDGLFVRDRRISQHDCSGPQSARALLRNPTVEAVVLETARGGILREGLGFDLADVAVVTNIGAGDHLGHKGIETPQELAWVKSTLVRAVHPRRGVAVLNAGDALVAGMAADCPGRVSYFAHEESHPLLASCRAQGSSAAFVRDGWLMLARGGAAEQVVPLDRVPLTHGGKVRFQIENVLAAALAAFDLGLSSEAIRKGLESFDASAGNPGRFNVFHAGEASLIVDYAHNSSALEAVVAALASLPQHGRRSAVYSGCNCRNDEVLRQGAILGRAFDRILLFADCNHTGRADGELNRLLREGIGQASPTRTRQVVEFAEEFEAVGAALAEIGSGEVVWLGVSSVERCLDLVRNCLPKIANAARVQ